MTIDKCEKCKYLKNKSIGYGDTALCCGKTNAIIRVSLEDYKTLINECPKENKNKQTKFRFSEDNEG